MAEVNVSTWDEFVNSVTNYNDTVNVTADIIVDSQIASPINMYATIEGNNHKIIGLSYKANLGHALAIGDNKIKNLHFVNINQTESYGTMFYRGFRWYGVFENCTFAGVIRKDFCTDANNASRTIPMFKNCSFALRGYNASFTGNGKPTLMNCDFMLYGTWANCTFGDLLSCRIQGEEIVTLNASSSYSGFENCAIDAVVKSNVNVSSVNSVINSEKVSGEIAGGLIAVTAEQMSDADYLNSIGFEVFEDVGNS